jgi:hypothetical protein
VLSFLSMISPGTFDYHDEIHSSTLRQKDQSNNKGSKLRSIRSAEKMNPAATQFALSMVSCRPSTMIDLLHRTNQSTLGKQKELCCFKRQSWSVITNEELSCS